jgi:DNA-binding beta-propeller fold protein YncE
LAFDSTGNLYVTNTGNNTVSKFAPGGTTPIATLTGLNNLQPHGLVVDSAGNVYVSNTDGTTISKLLWAAKAIEKGFKFRGLVGIKL